MQPALKQNPSSPASIPAEWAPHKAIWTAWPWDPEAWFEALSGAQDEVEAMIRALSGGDHVKVLACGGGLQSAKERLKGIAEIFEIPYGDTWLRDTGPIFGTRGLGGLGARGKLDLPAPQPPSPSAPIAHLFKFNGWGGKFIYPGDESVNEKIAAAANIPTQKHDFILEGGSLEFDGNGLCLTTRQCLLNPNRNKGWTETAATEALKTALGFEKILWLERGLPADHTDGHIDNLARFVAPGKVVCQHASGADDPNAAVLKEIETALRGMNLEVITIPSPGRIDSEVPELQAASHMNFIIGNKTVVVPVYNARGKEAVSALKPLFPGREVVGLPSHAILSGGGSFHCITQQEPE
ncbi:MAG: agmatine deiminase family protein [Proteobacteria bacterium]|nr:agmatine deiminase family protein [Pseudomonadota bacterium]